MLGAFANWINNGFVKGAEKGMTQAAKQEEAINFLQFEIMLTENVNEAILSGELDLNDLVNEGGTVKIPFVSSIAKKLNKIPPFKTLYGVKNAAKDIVGSGLEKFSGYATEVAGAPGPYKFIALATIIGIIVEMEVKGAFKSLLKFALHGIPFVGTVISWAATIAKYLAYIAIIETILAEAQGEEKEPEPQPKEA